MPALIDNMVETDTANYTFKTRDEAEAFFLALKSRHETSAEHHLPPATKVAKPTAAQPRNGDSD